mgnify:CR=1 FL=1
MSLVARGVTVKGSRGAPRVVDADVEAPPGLVTVVLGENGAGKSTFLDVLAGLLAPDAGDVQLFGASLRTLDPRARARAIASVAQLAPHAPLTTTTERIAHGLVPVRGTRPLLDETARAAVVAAARDLDVERHLASPLGALSGGERRRVELARGLVDASARAVILDEPFAGIDVSRRASVAARLRARARAGAVVVVSVHELDVAIAVGDRFVGLREGRVVARAQALDRAFVRAVFDVEARVVADGGARGVVFVEDEAPRDLS